MEKGKKLKVRLIAGRGALGDANWGAAGRPLGVLKKELAELKKHYGEEVVLTGGGGPGAHLAVLKSARIVPEGFMRNQPALKVFLTRVRPGMHYGEKESKFDPWIDSWQISVIEKPNPLMPEKIRGHLEWRINGPEIILSRGGIVVAIWNPNQDMGRRDLPRGIVSVYGEPSGKSFTFRSWHAWKKKVWEAYRMTPPASYSINPRMRHRRQGRPRIPSYGVHAMTMKPVSRKRAIRYGTPVMSMNPVSLRNQQSVYMVTPISQTAKDWVDENVGLESWQWMGGSFAVEHRYIADLVSGMTEAGLIVNKDFRVS